MAPCRNIINISSDEDDRCWVGKKKQSSDSDDDCVILDGDPDKSVRVVNDNSANESDELLVVAEKGQIACRDYPHARHLCARFPFNTNPHEKYCDLCHCYVCDTRAPCVYWGTAKSSGDHCHSTDKEEIWRVLRQSSKQGKMAQLPTTTLSNAPPLHPAPSRSQSLNSNEESGVLLGLRLALDRLTVQADRLTGTVKWFDSQKGYGFIIPDSGGEDLFVHKSSIKSKGYRCLAEGEAVEFKIGSGDDGRNKAIDVTGPGGSFVRGTTSDTSGRYICGETGHFARNCSYTGSSCGDTDYYDSSVTGQSLDQLTAQADRLSGTVKWFNIQRGYGFIIPDSGGEDLFVHQSSIKSKGYRSLAEGEAVEFKIGSGDDGRNEAIDVTRPGGSFGWGTTRRDNYCSNTRALERLWSRDSFYMGSGSDNAGSDIFPIGWE